MEVKDDFLGKGWGFPPEFIKEEGGIKMVSGEEDIQQSLRILFHTTMGERMMVPLYGCNLREFLFQNVDTSFIAYMRDHILNAILKYESRIDVNDFTINDTDILDGILILDLTYTVRTTNNRNNIVFPFYLTEGTLVDQ